MANERRLIDAVALEADLRRQYDEVFGNARKTVNPDDFFVERYAAYHANVIKAEVDGFIKYLKTRPTVNAVELPEGKPGDYLEWDNGTGFRQFYAIDSIMICRDCVRYALDNMAPVINHKNIVRILKEPEMREILKEKWANADNKQQQTYFSEERWCEDADD